ncbi:hypothetical protein Psi02_78710 [Planotetraspora silvatica]|uniref:HTH lysR-type domain-containing protein n=1 Tax=Planotetraspora silvatica TaxID=234614 RepID=A0A8J3UX42_9ACTN|nr:LysR substrate-binding domain-containing protein [Planotetraspora silvatica]GII51447.1 hypothetical protein Psi02_78710 [Planotetraspora silvatica]
MELRDIEIFLTLAEELHFGRTAEPELRRYWETFRTRHPQWELRLRMSGYADPFAQLRNGEADILVTWLPVEEPDLTVGPLLFAEPRVLAVAADAPLAK